MCTRITTPDRHHFTGDLINATKCGDTQNTIFGALIDWLKNDQSRGASAKPVAVTSAPIGVCSGCGIAVITGEDAVAVSALIDIQHAMYGYIEHQRLGGLSITPGVRLDLRQLELFVEVSQGMLDKSLNTMLRDFYAIVGTRRKAEQGDHPLYLCAENTSDIHQIILEEY